MSDSEYKKEFYSKTKTVKNYDSFRFKNKGGRYVHEQESRIIQSFLSDSDKEAEVLDLPVGTGRLHSTLTGMGFTQHHGSDFSEAMLKFCKETYGDSIRLSRQDAFDTNFNDDRFSVIVSLRFFFHFSEVSLLLKEFRRILNDDGILILDTIVWSPRARTDLFSQRLGGRLYTLSDKRFTEIASEQGFKVEKVEKILFIPSFFYNFMPGFVVSMVERIERFWPKRWFTKTVWKLSPLSQFNR